MLNVDRVFGGGATNAHHPVVLSRQVGANTGDLVQLCFLTAWVRVCLPGFVFFCTKLCAIRSVWFRRRDISSGSRERADPPSFRDLIG